MSGATGVAAGAGAGAGAVLGRLGREVKNWGGS